MLLGHGSQLFQSTLEAFDRREVSIELPIQVRELAAFGLELPDELTEGARLRPIA
jgi:hypothetical protein